MQAAADMGGRGAGRAKPPRVQAVVFDFDGTIADTRIDFARMRRLVLEMLTRRGLWREDLAERRYVLEIVAAGARAAEERGEDPRGVLNEAEALICGIEMDAAQRAPLLDGAAEALAGFRQAGVRTGIITRNCAEAVRTVLSRFPVQVDVIVPRDDAPVVKPSAAHLLQALEALRAQPERSALVGDHVTDVQCARAAGARAVALVGASSSAEELREAGADYVAFSHREVVGYLLDAQT